MFFFFFIFFISSFKIILTTEIAVCITGQTSRFLPKLIARLFQDNIDMNFHLFYNLQNSTSLIFSSDAHHSYKPSPYTNIFNENEMRTKLEHIYKDLENVSVQDIKYTTPKDKNFWIQYMDGKTNSIWNNNDYRKVELNVLNMYDKISACGKQVEHFQIKNKFSFDYLINTREDIYFFKKMNLKFLLPKIKESKLSISGSCDYLFKECLSWGGVSQRFYILDISKGIKYISSKLSYYKDLTLKNSQIYNSEQFDLYHLQSLNYKPCGISIEDYPVTAARHTFDENFCFIRSEIQNCYPEGFENFVNLHKCK